MAEMCFAGLGCLLDIPFSKELRGRHFPAILIEHGTLSATIKAGEEIEDQGLAVNRKTARKVALNVTVSEVPSGRVTSRVANYIDFLKERRRQIHPPLVGEEAAGNISPAKVAQPISPPPGKAATFG